MKNLYFIALVALSATIGRAQIVNIPDAAFKAKLLTLSPAIDTNGDGEIQQSEADAVTSISLGMCTLDNVIGLQSFTNLTNLNFSSYCSIANAVDVSGMSSLKSIGFHKCSMPSINLGGLTALENFSMGYVTIPFSNLGSSVNLKTMYFFNSNITTLDLSPFVNLTEFSAENVGISSITTTGLSNITSFHLKTSSAGTVTGLDLSSMANLKTLYLSGCHLTEINFQNNPLLEDITTWDNNFSTFNVSMLPNLKKLFCTSSNLSTLDVSNNPELEMLICAENHLTSIDLGNSHKLQIADFSNNLFTELDFSGFTQVGSESPSYTITGNPNLASLNLKNGKKDYVGFDSSCPNLVYLCLDDPDMSDQAYLLQQAGIENVQINTYCSFVPGGNYNTITGSLTFDGDNNGCDANDFRFPNVKLSLAAENQNGSTYSNSTGNYNFYTQTGSFVVTPQFENPYFTISPASATITFADGNNNSQTQNFCITPNGVHNDVEVTLIPVQNARPGFDAHYRIAYKNKGNQAVSGSIDLNFDDSVLDFVGANPAVATQSLNQLHWNYSNLLPFENRTIDFTLNVNSPMETPAVNNGDVLNFTVSAPVAGDEMVADNSAALSQTVVGSFDPNDKTCLEGSTITPQMVGDYLHYLVRFQNSGTYQAQNIVVKDVIDTDKFDVSTLELTSSSHPHKTRIDGNLVEFIFDGINLPTQATDEAASQGFVAFKIKTKPSLTLNDVVENTADIYFDFNFPIATNTTSTRILELATAEFDLTSVSMSPNPVQNMLTVSAKDIITSVQIFDVQGRLLQTSMQNRNDASIDFSGKSAGVYFVKVSTTNGTKVQKIIKQ